MLTGECLMSRILPSITALFFAVAILAPDFSWSQELKPAAVIELDNGDEYNGVTLLRFSPDGKMLAAADLESTIHGIDVAGKKQFSKWKFDLNVFTSEIAFPANNNNAVFLWDYTFAAGVDFSTAGADLTRSSKYLSVETDLSDVYSSLHADNRTLLVSSNRQDREKYPGRFIEPFDLATLKRLGKIQLTGDSGPVAYRPGGKEFAAAIEDEKIAIFDSASGKQLSVISPPDDPAFSTGEIFRFSPDGNKLIVSARQYRYYFYDLKEKNITRYAVDGDSKEIAWDPKNRIFAIGHSGPGKTDTISIGNPADGTIRLKLATTLPVSVAAVAISPDGQWLAAGGRTNRVELWKVADIAANLADAHIPSSLRVPDKDPKTFPLEMSGEVAANTSVEPPVGEPKTGDDPPASSGGNLVLTAPQASIDVIKFSADGKQLFVGMGIVHDKSEEDGYVLTYDLATGKQTARFGDRYEGITAMALHPGKPGHVLIADAADTIEHWDMSSSPPTQVGNFKASGIINGLNFTPDGANLVVGEVRRIFVKPADDLAAKGRDLTGAEVITQAMDVSTDGKYIASVTGDAEVIVYNIADGSVKAKFESDLGGGYHVAFSPKANVIAFQDAEDDETIALADVETGGIVGRLKLPESSNPGDSGINNVTLIDLAFSPDGKLLLAGGSNGDAYLYDMASGKLIKQILDHAKNDTDGKGIQAFTKGNIKGVAFSPDSARFATGAGDGTIRVYEVAQFTSGKVAATGATTGGEPSDPGPEPTGAKDFPTRTWKTADGKHSIKAALVAVADGVVELKREDGQTSKVPAGLLSTRDNEYLRNVLPEAFPDSKFPMRFWTTADGKSRIKASYVSSDGSSVTILREDGRTATVPLNILHERDRTYVSGLGE